MCFAGALFAGTPARAAVPDCAAESRRGESDAVSRHLAEGRCWLEAGQYGAALLAAERFLAYRPGDPDGVALRDAALQMIKIAKPAPSVPDTAAAPATARGWIAAQAGYDTNLNSGTDAAEVSLPLFRGLIVDIDEDLGDLRRRSSPFLGLHGGFAGRAAITPQNTLRVDGFASARANSKAIGYLPSILQFTAQADHRIGIMGFAVTAGVDERWVGRHHILNAGTLGVRVVAALAGGYVPGAFFTQSDRKIPIFSNQPSREQRYGLTLEHPGVPFRASIYEGTERSKNQVKFLDRNFRGFAAEYSYDFGAAGRLDIAVQQVRSAFVEFSQLFLGHRLDHLREIHVAYEYRFRPGWTLTPRFIRQVNRSDIVVTAFRRTQVLAEIRREY